MMIPSERDSMEDLLRPAKSNWRSNDRAARGARPRSHLCSKHAHRLRGRPVAPPCVRVLLDEIGSMPSRDIGWAGGIRPAAGGLMRQTALWLDQNEARVFHVDANSFDKDTIHAPNNHVHRHPKDQETKTRNHPDDEARFFDEVLAHLGGSEEVLVMGPSMTKLHFLRYALRMAPSLASSIVGLESADHPTDREFVAYIRHYFHKDAPRLGLAR
jgi:hypothetical protein